MGPPKGRIPWNKGRKSGQTKKCILCGAEFQKPPSQLHVKYCSQKCYHAVPENHAKNKGMHWNLSEESRKKQSVHQLGVNNHNWKGGITEPRRSIENKKWVRFIKKRDSHLCRICGCRGDVAHHLYSYNNYKELRFEKSNGLTLCVVCHEEFHKKYGYGNNTLAQFIEWTQNENSKNNQNTENQIKISHYI